MKGVVRNDWCSTHWSDGGVVPIFYNCQLSRTLSISTQQPDQATGSTGGLQQSKQQRQQKKAELPDCQLQRRPLLQKGWRECWRWSKQSLLRVCSVPVCTSIINICTSISAHQYLLINVCPVRFCHSVLLIWSKLTSTRVLVGLIGTDVQTNVLNDGITHFRATQLQNKTRKRVLIRIF